MGAVLPHVGAMCNRMEAVTPYGNDAVCTIWSWVGAMGLGQEPGSHLYSWFYSVTLIATLGATVAKEHRCGACRRLV
jgi:hypothetical protein